MATKKKFESMSTNEWLGDSTTHFMKSGNTFRSPDNTDLEKLASFIPRQANGVKVEYDISYNIPNEIHGYKYTDFLTKCIYISPCNNKFALHNIVQVASKTPTEEGREIMAQLRESITDKYILDNDDEDFDNLDDLIILPGTNLLVKELVDLEKIDGLVRDGAYVKLHPITSEVWQSMLKKRWGRQVIPADAPLYPIIRSAKKVWFTMSSETGLASTILGKKMGTINSTKPSTANFEFIYRGLDTVKGPLLVDKLAALFSHPESGIITVYHKNPQEALNRFFENMKKYKHK